jgi:GH24 family phage-related lysozyme (muramidase)
MEKQHLIELLRILWERIRRKPGFPQKSEFHALNTSKGIFRISKESFDFILDWESFQCHPHIQGGDSNSGITLGYGYDLGHQSAATVRNELAGIYGADEIERLAAVTGKTRDDARSVLPGLIDIDISRENAMRLALIMSGRYAEKVVSIYPQVMKFHPHCQGALLSLVINRGTSFTLPSVDSRREMKEIQEDFVNGTPENIPDRLTSMKRLWRHSGQGGLLKRRDGEAELFRKGLSCARRQ